MSHFCEAHLLHLQNLWYSRCSFSGLYKVSEASKIGCPMYLRNRSNSWTQVQPRHDRSPIAWSAIWAAIFFWRSRGDRRFSLQKIIARCSPSRNLLIARSLVKTGLEINSFQNSDFVVFFMSSELKKIIAMLASFERAELFHISLFFFHIITNGSTSLWIKRSPKRSRDRGAAIAIGSQMIFQIGIGIAIAISISDEDRDRDRDLDFGDRGHALLDLKITLFWFIFS